MSGVALDVYAQFSRAPMVHPTPPVRVGEPTAAEVIDAAAKLFGVTAEDLTAQRRTQPLVLYRQVAMAAVRQVTSCSYPQIAKAFGRRDHTTVIHACEMVRADRRRGELLEQLLPHIRRVLL